MPGCYRRAEVTNAKAHKFCSLICLERYLTLRITCQAEKCSKLVLNATTTIPGLPSMAADFDMAKFCSGICAGLVVCEVCATSKPLQQCVHRSNKKYTPSVPPDCLFHVAPQMRPSKDGVCVERITMHLTTRLKDRGLQSLNCIMRGCNHRIGDEWMDWRLCALSSLPVELREEFAEQSLQTFISGTGVWVCPKGCNAPEVTISLIKTPGYPHVECPLCTGRFCAGCKEDWHEGMTCQQYQLETPQTLSKEEMDNIEIMAQLKARPYPRCQSIIVKDGGCENMDCEQRGEGFDWREAEKVRYLRPAPQDSELETLSNTGHDLQTSVKLHPAETPVDSEPLTWAQRLFPAAPPATGLMVSETDPESDDDSETPIGSSDSDDSDDDSDDESFFDKKLPLPQQECEMDVIARRRRERAELRKSDIWATEDEQAGVLTWLGKIFKAGLGR